MQETQEMRVRSLSWEEPLKEEMATCSSILGWKIPWTEEPGRLQSMGSQRVGHNWMTEHAHTHLIFRQNPIQRGIKTLEKGGVGSMSRQTEPAIARQGDLQALEGSTVVEGCPVLRDPVPPEKPRSTHPFTSCHGKSSRTRHPEERGADPMWLRWRLRHWWHGKLELEVQLCQGKQRSLCCFLTWVCGRRFVFVTRGVPRDFWQHTSELRYLRAVASFFSVEELDWENEGPSEAAHDSGNPPFSSFCSASEGKESVCNAGDKSLILGSGRSPGRRHGNPLQYSCLENSMDRGAWCAAVRGFAKSWTQLRD